MEQLLWEGPACPQMMKHRVVYHPARPFPGIYSREMRMYVPQNFVILCIVAKKVETTQMPINRQMDKPRVVYP